MLEFARVVLYKYHTGGRELQALTCILIKQYKSVTDVDVHLLDCDVICVTRLPGATFLIQLLVRENFQEY